MYLKKNKLRICYQKPINNLKIKSSNKIEFEH